MRYLKQNVHREIGNPESPDLTPFLLYHMGRNTTTPVFEVNAWFQKNGWEVVRAMLDQVAEVPMIAWRLLAPKMAIVAQPKVQNGYGYGVCIYGVRFS